MRLREGGDSGGISCGGDSGVSGSRSRIPSPSFSPSRSRDSGAAMQRPRCTCTPAQRPPALFLNRLRRPPHALGGAAGRGVGVQEDQNTIASLKREIEKAWKMVDVSHDKEARAPRRRDLRIVRPSIRHFPYMAQARAKETISQLKTEIANLSRLIEQGAGLSVGQENTVNELMREKDELTAERDAQIAQIATLRAEIGTHLAAIRQREGEVPHYAKS